MNKKEYNQIFQIRRMLSDPEGDLLPIFKKLDTLLKNSEFDVDKCPSCGSTELTVLDFSKTQMVNRDETEWTEKEINYLCLNCDNKFEQYLHSKN